MGKIISHSYLKNPNKIAEQIKIFGNHSFRIGIFLLPSVFFFSCLFLLISFLISSFYSRNIFSDKWNISLFTCAILMIFVCLISNLEIFAVRYNNFDKTSNWLGILNWIPMFWIFICSQKYLKNISDRVIFAKILLLGTIPLLISGFCQYFLKWYGPFELLNGAIIWYQRESQTIQSLTGPFNNANYAGSWLAAVLPFSFFFVIKTTKIGIRKIIYISLSFLIILASLLTLSRNAIIANLVSLLLTFGISFKLILIILLIIFSSIFSIFIFELPLDLPNFISQNKMISSFIPNTNKFNDILNFTRIKIWKTTILNIFNRPFLGWGAATFSFLYSINNAGPTFQHTHNIILEVAHNYGIPVSLILFITLLNLISKSRPKQFEIVGENKFKYDSILINKFWWISSIVIFLMHQTDITYYDGRISILFWLIFAGLRCIIKEDQYISKKH